MLKFSRGTISLILFVFSTQLAVLTDRTLAGVEDVLYKEGVISKEVLDKIKAERRKDVLSTPAEQPDNAFGCFWKNGFICRTADKEHTIQFGGRVQADYAFATGGEDVKSALGRDSLGDGAEIRRVRLFAAGTIYDTVKFKAEFGFGDQVAGDGGGEVSLKDAYIEFRKIPYIGNIRTGHFKEPFSLDELTSSKYYTFMERATPNALRIARNIGIMAHNKVLNQRATYAVGVFMDADDLGDTSAGGALGEEKYNFTARLTGLPYYMDKGRKLAHLGVAYSYRNPLDNDGDGTSDVRFRQRPEAHMAPRFVDTGRIEFVDKEQRLAVEGAGVWGPLSFQSEYIQTWIDLESRPDPTFSGYYFQGSYFLTGEHRPYSKSSGVFGRLKPKENFLGKGGRLGAWEVAARYSHLDLNDANIGGGKLDNYTFGLNWYLNPNVRWMVNAVLSKTKDSVSVVGITDGNAQFYQTRVQIDW